MEQSTIKELSTPELVEKLQEEKNNYNKLTMAHAVSPLENPMQIRNLRKTVARLSTEVKKRQLQDK